MGEVPLYSNHLMGREGVWLAFVLLPSGAAVFIRTSIHHEYDFT